MSKVRRSRLGKTLSKVTPQDISATHFEGMPLETDMFYANLANSILPSISGLINSDAGFVKGAAKRIAIAFACYVEDLVSGSGVWKAFISLFKKKYKKNFPFYNTRERILFVPRSDEEGPSFYDVLFLLWYFANDLSPDVFLNPNNSGLRMQALSVYFDLKKAYDEAPDTEGRPILMPEEKAKMPLYSQIRNLCSWLCYRCYLTRLYDERKATASFAEFIHNSIEDTGHKDKGLEAYAVNVSTPMLARIGPLAIPAHEWLAEIVAIDPEPQEERYIPILQGVETRPYAIYRYVTVSERESVIEDVEGEKFVLSAATIPGGKFSPDIAPGHSAMFSLMKVDGAWLMNGMAALAFGPEEYIKRRDEHRTRIKQDKLAYKTLMDAFDKQRLGVFASYEDFRKIIDSSGRRFTEAAPSLLAEIKKAGNFLYFINSNGRFTLLPGWAPCVKIKDNPFYDPDAAADDGIVLIIDHGLASPEMRQYIIKNKLIPDAAFNSTISPKMGRDLFQHNIRFLNDYSDRDTLQFVMV